MPATPAWGASDLSEGLDPAALGQERDNHAISRNDLTLAVTAGIDAHDAQRDEWVTHFLWPFGKKSHDPARTLNRGHPLSGNRSILGSW